MRKKHGPKTLPLAALALALVLGSTATPSLSYFTTYVSAQGSKQIILKDVEVEIEDRFETQKEIRIHNTGDAPCYARIRIFSEPVATTVTPGEGWTDGGDGYWYYSEVLQPGDGNDAWSTLFLVSAKLQGSELPEEQDFNIIVVAECALVLYDDDGNVRPNGPTYIGWSLEAAGGEEGA